MLIDARQWMPLTPDIVGTQDLRSPAVYGLVIDQFNVETEDRYAPTKTATYCNIFASDVMDAMHACLPHWVDDAGNQARHSDKGARELTANATAEWLREHGARHGWREMSERTAQIWASYGMPSVAIWRNESRGHGHVTVIRPGEYDDKHGALMAQAGAVCTRMARRDACFGRNKYPLFYAHR